MCIYDVLSLILKQNYLLFFSETIGRNLKSVNKPGQFVVDPIYGLTINAQILEGLKGASSRNKMALALLEKLFSGDVLAKSTVAGSKQSKSEGALDNKLMAIKKPF